MQRINQYEFYNLGVVLHALEDVGEKTTAGSIHFELYQAQEALGLLLKEKKPIDLVVAEGQIRALLASVTAAMPQWKKDMPPDEWQKELGKELGLVGWRIGNALRDFETVLAAELQTLDSYFISKKGIYSTADLIEHTENALSETVREAMPSQAITDFRQAGKCLAFDLFTAAGFHCLRATDAVIRAYYAQFVGHAPKPKLRNWGAYIRILKGCIKTPPMKMVPDLKTLELVDHIRDMHRNPIIHPEDNLDEDKAIVLFDLCKSAIVAMITEMKEAEDKARAIAQGVGTSLLVGPAKVKALK